MLALPLRAAARAEGGRDVADFPSASALEALASRAAVIRASDYSPFVQHKFYFVTGYSMGTTSERRAHF
jgi:hypothetical protein